MDIATRNDDPWEINLCRNLRTRDPAQALSWAAVDDFHTPDKFMEVGGLEEIGARRVFAPVINAASVVQWGYVDGAPMYTLAV
jgi:hypothetical protein